MIVGWLLWMVFIVGFAVCVGGSLWCAAWLLLFIADGLLRLWSVRWAIKKTLTQRYVINVMHVLKKDQKVWDYICNEIKTQGDPK